MPSVINPTTPVDGVPASKAEMRANFAAIRQEVEHGGFYTGLAGTERPVRDYIIGQRVDVREFGAKGDNVDDTAALQNALNSKLPLYFPPGTYRVTAPLIYNDTVRMKGAGGKQQGGNFSRIVGNFANPLIHRQGILVDHNDALADSSNLGAGTGPYFIAEDILFANENVDGTCIQIYNTSAPVSFVRCGFQSNFRGLMLLQVFDALIANCYFASSHFSVRTFADGVWPRAYGLYANAHTTATGCSFQGWGTAIYAEGAEVNLMGHRIEVNGYGIILGGTTLAPDVFGDPRSLSRSLISGISMESNIRHILVQKIGSGVEISNIGIQGGTNGPLNNGDGKGEYGVWVDEGRPDAKIKNISVSGYFKQAPWYFDGGMPLEGLTANQGEPNRPVMGASSQPVSQKGPTLSYAIIRTPLNPSISGEVTVFSDLQLRGLKGLNLRDKAQPNNLGGIESVTQSATTHAVAFTNAVGAGNVAFNSVPTAQNDAGSTLPAGTYYYAVTRHTRRGETGIESLTSVGNNYRSVTISSGQRVDMSSFGGTFPVGSTYRWYRGTQLGRFSGYFETTNSSFSDTGQAFDGADMPPSIGVSVPANHEPDANYAVVVTTNWGTTAWVTNKTATGFTINFGTAAPSGAEAQWLLFRP
jgi:hypothetical protein